MEQVLDKIKANKSDTVAIMADGDFISIPNKLSNVTLRSADSSFFANLPPDTAFRFLKVLPIRVIKNELMIPVSYYRFKQHGNEGEMVFIKSYYFYFKNDCRNLNFHLYKVDEQEL